MVPKPTLRGTTYCKIFLTKYSSVLAVKKHSFKIVLLILYKTSIRIYGSYFITIQSKTCHTHKRNTINIIHNSNVINPVCNLNINIINN